MVETYGVVQVETYTWERTWIRRLTRPLIWFLCRLAAWEVEFVPYGLGGDRVPAWFRCWECSKSFYNSVSMANEEIVTCPHCETKFLTFNDCRMAWIRRRVDN
jgi:DNA-directed RNA polymerase subunit RPC12/RpoP